MEENNYLRVSTIGMSQQSTNALRMFFCGPCLNNYILVDDKSEDICIIDLDAYNAKQELKDYRNKYPHRLTILESINLATIKNEEFFLRKPVSSEALKTILNKVKTRLQSKSTKETVIVPVTNKSAASNTVVAQITTMKLNKKQHFEQNNIEPVSTKNLITLVKKARQISDGNLAINNPPLLDIEYKSENIIENDAKISPNIVPILERGFTNEIQMPVITDNTETSVSVKKIAMTSRLKQHI